MQQKVDDEGLPGLFLAECVQGCGQESETQRHGLQSLTAHLLVLRIRLISGISLQNTAGYSESDFRGIIIRANKHEHVLAVRKLVRVKRFLCFYLLIDLADLLIRAKDQLNASAA